MENESAPPNVFDLVNQQQSFFENVLTTDRVIWAKESQFAIQQLQKNSYLQGAAVNQPGSLQNAIINVAAIGISLNPANKHAYLVPRKPDKDSPVQVCLDISYMGLMHLAMQSGSIEWGQAKLVYQNDRYVNNGIDKAPTHEQQTFGDKGGIVGVYCTVKLPNGDYLTEEMDITALDKVKGTSKAANGPWKTWPEEMIRKTVVKRASKYWPSSESVNTAITVLNEHEGLERLEDYTEEEKKELDRLIQSDLAFSMCAFMYTKDDEKQTALYNSFPRGQITDNKKKITELSKLGFYEWQTFCQDVRSYIAEEDAISLRGELDGFTKYEKLYLATMLGDEDSEKLGRILNNETC